MGSRPFGDFVCDDCSLVPEAARSFFSEKSGLGTGKWTLSQNGIVKLESVAWVQCS